MRAGRCRAEQGRAKGAVLGAWSERAGQSREGQARAGQGRAGQGRSGQGRATVPSCTGTMLPGTADLTGGTCHTPYTKHIPQFTNRIMYLDMGRWTWYQQKACACRHALEANKWTTSLHLCMHAASQTMQNKLTMVLYVKE